MKDRSSAIPAWLAWTWLCLAVGCLLWSGYRFSTGQVLETNLLALLPSTERNPRAELAVNVLGESLGNRAVFLVGQRQAEQAHAAARAFAAELRASGAFRRIIDSAPRADARLLTDFYAPYRFGLLAESDRAALASPAFDADARLARRLYQPLRAGIATDLGDDPYGTLQNWLSALPLTQTRLEIEDDQLVARDDSATWVLALAELPGSAYDGKVQAATAHAVAAAEATLQRGWPEVRLLRTGGVFYGAAAREAAQSEMDLIGAGSLLGILLLLWLLFRSLRPLALGLLTVALGIGCATAAVLAVFGQLHLITLVFGASLIGEAVDYSIQFFAAQLAVGRDWQPQAAIRRLLRPLAIALATSLIGYGALALTPFPAISQIALFAFVGLAAAWISVVVLLPRLARKPLTRDAEQATRWPRAFLNLWRTRIARRQALLIAAACLLLALPGWCQLSADDDIRQLVSRPQQLVAEEEQIRTLTGMTGGSRFFLVEGRDDEETLQREEALTARIKGAPGIAGTMALSAFVPSAARQSDNHQLLETALLSDPRQTQNRLGVAGFRDEVAADWIAAARSTPPVLTLSDWLASPLSTPWRHLKLPGAPATLVVPQGDSARTDLAALARDLPGVTLVDKAGSVSRLFQQYRQWSALWLPAACLIVLAVLAWRYGLRNGAAVLLPTLLGGGLALAAYGYAGLPLTLFGLMGLMLVLGVGVNYAIFLVEAGDRAPAPFAGVLLSAATTLLSFGLLALSSMPALKHFGLMLLIGIAAAVALAPLALSLWRPRCA